MNILYEEDGCFKVGGVMADNTTSLQVESVTGKRSKVKAAHVMLHFTQPSLAEFLPLAEKNAAGMEVDFLWECCPQDEFGFEQIAADYFGHKPSSLEAASVLICLHGAPIYFHRKGKGRYRAAPPDVLKAALAGAEKKRQQLAWQARMVEQLCRFELPDEFVGRPGQLLYKPDRNTIEVKALEAACAATHMSAAHLLQRCGALPSTHDYHLQRFLYEHFPNGTELPQVELDAWDELPLASVNAFSIDDTTTTEIDDAFSVEKLANGNWRIGVHIAAPALGMPQGSAGDRIASQRLSTVYMPGRKITMLPDNVVDAFTLCAERVCPALSMYNEIDGETLEISGHESRIERVHIAANLRHETLEPLFNEATLAAGRLDYPYAAELTLLWNLAQKLEAKRGKQSDNQQVDYNFHIESVEHVVGHPDDRVTITQRQRGSPIDKVVSELMILVNSEWGRHLSEHGFAGIYRTQHNGKVKMSTVAAPHQGLGVSQYMWSSSPLRRYVDMVNQRQIIAMLRDDEPAYEKNATSLYAAMRDFDTMYTIYGEFQRDMERYWCLRWLQQEIDDLSCADMSPASSMETDAADTQVNRLQDIPKGEGSNGAEHPLSSELPRRHLVVTATVLRENLVRLTSIPLVFRVASLPQLAAHTRVQLSIISVDLLDLDVQARFVATLEEVAAC